jgi:hypothetical protein
MGFRVQGSGFGVEGVVVRLLDLKFSVQGQGFRMRSSGLRL